MNGTPVMLGSILTSFFHDHLKLQKGLRPNSITSYADAMRLFLQFVATSAGKKITQVNLDDLDAGAVCSFLNSLEDGRCNSVGSRNQRLAALRTFFEYIGQRFPDRLGQAQKVTCIPRKRSQPPETVLSATRLNRFWRDFPEKDAACCGIGRYSCSFTTRAHVLKKLRTCASATFTSITPLKYIYTARGTSGVSARSGRKLRR